jgi:hypothetical protein
MKEGAGKRKGAAPTVSGYYKVGQDGNLIDVVLEWLFQAGGRMREVGPADDDSGKKWEREREGEG